MVLGAAHGETMIPRSGVVLALLDVTEHGVEHVAVYAGSEGQVTELLGSFDVAPFGTRYEAVQQLLRLVDRYDPPATR